MSARSIWKGSLTAGLVTINIKAYKATDDSDSETAGNEVHQNAKGETHQVGRKNFCATCNAEVAYPDIAKGIKQPDGTFVILTKEDLATIRPASTDHINVDSFVPTAELAALYVATSYYLTPDGAGSIKAYALLQQAMVNTGRSGFGRLTIYGREQSVTIKPQDSGLILQLMRSKTEVRDAKELPGYVAPNVIKLDAVEIKMAEQLVGIYAGEFDPLDYVDSYVEDFKALVEAKRTGKTVLPKTAIVPQTTTDLMSALKASLDAKKVIPVKKLKPGAVQKGKSSKGIPKGVSKLKQAAG